jgi:hypothetical protein
MRNHDPVLLSRKVQEDGIGRSAKAAALDIEDVDRRLTGPQAVDDIGVEVFIR